jgi:predicted ribosome quality control (RQC) complex YloA/Tae2 family protein
LYSDIKTVLEYVLILNTVKTMNLTLPEMLALCSEISPLVKDLPFVSFSEISSKHYVLTVGHLKLLICLQQPFLRFHLIQNRNNEKNTPWTLDIQSLLKDSVVSNMQILNEDRILRISFLKNKSLFHIIVELFPKKTNLFLTNGQMEILSVLHPIALTHYVIPQKPKNVKTALTTRITSVEIEKHYDILESDADFKLEKLQIYAHLEAALKKELKRKEKILQELQKCQNWTLVHHEADLLQANLYRIKKGMKEITIVDWESDLEITIALDSLNEPHIAIAKMYKDSKKLRAGISHQQKQLDQSNIALEKIKKSLEELIPIESWQSLEFLRKQHGKYFAKKQDVVKNEKGKLSLLPYRELTTAMGLKIWVGKSAKDNDKLTFQYSKGSDWWLHVHNFPGSHVILKVSKNQVPDEESLKDAMLVAIYNSKAKGEGAAEVCITQCKFVSRIGQKKQGQVHISKHQVVFVKWDQKRWELLVSR